VSNPVGALRYPHSRHLAHTLYPTNSLAPVRRALRASQSPYLAWCYPIFHRKTGARRFSEKIPLLGNAVYESVLSGSYNASR
jgi:hypothetical protein